MVPRRILIAFLSTDFLSGMLHLTIDFRASPAPDYIARS
jgi:hypothetical protein